MIAALVVHHSTNTVSSVMEGAGDSQNSQVQRYGISMKCSKVEFLKFDGQARGGASRGQGFAVALGLHEVKIDHRGSQLGGVGTVQDYLDKFDELLNCVDLLEGYAVSCLLAGLQSDIFVRVRLFRPKNLQEAISFAKLQEQAIYFTNK
ncbi:hypothetical protein Sango_2067100 [Sesamum angolense]|uniref:Uncharacterized protein n=1 Tax=Sesamum angolense TaxID=2727404 RepID=A0AAE1WB33_9LAMI|nr:hypothetical protein Sango_2067100 [Sesamum angolense]